MSLRHSREIEPTPGWAALLAELERLPAVLVAFSGGVDSTLLAKACRDVLGDRATAVTAVSPSLSPAERAEARDLARLIGIEQVEVETNEGEDPLYVANSPRRCHACKSHLFAALGELARGAGGSVMVYGAITDDLGDVRPGMDAAREAGARAPLLEAGLSKAEVRELSRRLGLPTADKPALACLASRIPHGTPVTPARLAAVDAAETGVRALGFRQVRVRHLGEVGRVEVEPDEVPRALKLADRIAEALRAAGFSRSEIDPSGYRRPGAAPLLITSVPGDPRP